MGDVGEGGGDLGGGVVAGVEDGLLAARGGGAGEGVGDGAVGEGGEVHDDDGIGRELLEELPRALQQQRLEYVVFFGKRERYCYVIDLTCL